MALTGLEITRMFASGAESAAALAKSRTIDAFVLNRSRPFVSLSFSTISRASRTVASHSRLAGDSSRDQHNLGTL